MWFSPSLMLFCFSIALSIFIILSSPSLLISWLGLELNTLAFIPLILTSKNSLTSEASIKYFLTQTVASILFLSACLLNNLNLGNLFLILLLVSLSIKLGAAPFHSWLPSVASHLNWFSLFTLLTIQKINPLLILMDQISYSSIYLIIIISSLIVGAIQGLNQTLTRLILTFSSINHVGWLLTTTIFNSTLTMLYFSLYIILLLPVTLILNKNNTNHINQLNTINIPVYFQPLIFLTLLSLGGLPPFLGFLPKWVILQTLMSYEFYLICSVMIFTSLITLYFYLRITFSAFIMSNNKNMIIFKSNNLPNITIVFSFISLTGLILTFLI